MLKPHTKHNNSDCYNDYYFVLGEVIISSCSFLLEVPMTVFLMKCSNVRTIIIDIMRMK